MSPRNEDKGWITARVGSEKIERDSLSKGGRKG